jgi:thiol-disulfide isomerase/thioredoxin
MGHLEPGSRAPTIAGAGPNGAPRAVFFYKVTCPVCQMAAPPIEGFQRAYPGHILGVGQDPEPKLAAFAGEHGMSFPSVPDLPPYPVSDAYGIEVVPTLFVVDAGGAVVAAVESWDRDRVNEASRALAELVGAPYSPISEPGDGLPPFRPG